MGNLPVYSTISVGPDVCLPNLRIHSLDALLNTTPINSSQLKHQHH
jgi:hypothetical protein